MEYKLINKALPWFLYGLIEYVDWESSDVECEDHLRRLRADSGGTPLLPNTVEYIGYTQTLTAIISVDRAPVVYLASGIRYEPYARLAMELESATTVKRVGNHLLVFDPMSSRVRVLRFSERDISTMPSLRDRAGFDTPIYTDKEFYSSTLDLEGVPQTVDLQFAAWKSRNEEFVVLAWLEGSKGLAWIGRSNKNIVRFQLLQKATGNFNIASLIIESIAFDDRSKIIYISDGINQECHLLSWAEPAYSDRLRHAGTFRAGDFGARLLRPTVIDQQETLSHYSSLLIFKNHGDLKQDRQVHRIKRPTRGGPTKPGEQVDGPRNNQDVASALSFLVSVDKETRKPVIIMLSSPPARKAIARKTMGFKASRQLLSVPQRWAVAGVRSGDRVSSAPRGGLVFWSQGIDEISVVDPQLDEMIADQSRRRKSSTRSVPDT